MGALTATVATVSLTDNGPSWSGQISAANKCDLNADGVVDSADVQIATSQALNNSCTTADLDGNGVCNVIDVQRIINAANGQACRMGP